MVEKGAITEHASKTAVGTIIVVILTAIAGSIVTAVSPSVHAFVFTVAPAAVGRFFHWMGAPVPVTRWIYWFLVSFVGVVIVLVVMGTIAGLRTPKLPEYLEYREDNFADVIWRWQWTPNGHFDESSLAPYCPHCDRLMVSNHPSYSPTTQIICMPCHHVVERRGSPADAVGEVRREIDVKVRNQRWPKPPTRTKPD